MEKFIIYVWHKDHGTGFIKLNKGQSAIKLIERGQKNMRAQGLQDSITWQTHEGNIVSAMVAASKL